jgi:hypothetical protein
MPRIRSIKPEFFDSPGTRKASPLARLLYIAMWCWADDWGIGDANPRRLLGFAFPHDDDPTVIPRNFPGIAWEIAEAYGVVWYEAGGRPYYYISSWESHQRTDKRSAKRAPTPDQAERMLYIDPMEIPRGFPGIPGDGPYGTGEQGNRGTGGKKVGLPVTQDARDDSEPPRLETNIPRHVLPQGWGPNTAHKAYALERSIDLDHELRQFRAHCRSRRTTSLDWDAEFEKWLGNARAPKSLNGAPINPEQSKRMARTARASVDEIPPAELDDDPSRTVAWVREFRRAVGDGSTTAEARASASRSLGLKAVNS